MGRCPWRMLWSLWFPGSFSFYLSIEGTQLLLVMNLLLNLQLSWCLVTSTGALASACPEVLKNRKAIFRCIAHPTFYLPLPPLALQFFCPTHNLPSLKASPPWWCSLHLSSRPCKCTDHLDFKTVGPLFISGQAAAWFYRVIKVLTGVIKASNCTAETLGVYFKGPWVFILLLLWGLVKAAWSEPSDWLLTTEVVKITALDKLFQSQ